MAEPQSNREIDEQEIRELAQQKWQEAGCPVGDGSEFWYAAEKELNEQEPDIKKSQRK